ncbi:MAG: TrkH family potassium uptake protein [Ruminococcaceae bacterium]|nr:TrkH family potassium uptake protein [Oscillospiraceae bacterium]
MNYRMIWQVLGRVLGIEALLLLLPTVVCLIYGESPLHFLIVIGIAGVLGCILWRVPVKSREIYAREGFMIVALSWVSLSAVGALPFVLSGDIPHYIDALFETVSGFTTTGASILTDIPAMSRGCMFWRCFTHWVGGMGVLVFIMAVLPMSGEYSMHIMRAEVPGPTVGKLVPRARKTAAILYLIYIGLTALEVIFLLCGGLDLYDALVHSFATAGTGGFSNQANSIGQYDSVYVDVVVSVFMLLFGVNFNLYFFILIGKFSAAFKNEELRWYLGIVAFATVTMAASIASSVGGFGQGLRYALFQVSSIITTTGFATANFDLWPEYCRALIVLIMFVGACAGSTGGGMKVSRIMILLRTARVEIGRLLRPRSVRKVRLEGASVASETVHCTLVFCFLYIAILVAGTVAISLNGYDFTTNFTSVLTCISNVGPGLNLVGPAANFAFFAWPSKLLLTLCMLIGRLEIFPMLILLSPTSWKGN